MKATWCAERGHCESSKKETLHSPVFRPPVFPSLFSSPLGPPVPGTCVSLGARRGLGALSHRFPETRGDLRVHLHAVTVASSSQDMSTGHWVGHQAAGKVPVACMGSITKSHRKSLFLGDTGPCPLDSCRCQHLLMHRPQVPL